ncbi:hypothetical protein AVEN_194145-1 [Araneus ventricosus]|uniref:Peptidase A2 domain-containing protein n=1 Tax=Araneus ventricosus TaxID=182803 RepID=A0A4Y2Q0S5_ARAVE|nr:hypothetical protein AVEN_194145-1 [Araneus ventricosus]
MLTTCVGGKAANYENPPVYTAAKLVKSFVSVALNEHIVNDLVDSGAAYSVVSEQLRIRLRRPCFRNAIRFFEQPVQWSHTLILGWDVFKAKDAIIDCGSDKFEIGEASSNDLQMIEVNSGLYTANDVVIPVNLYQKGSCVS